MNKGKKERQIYVKFWGGLGNQMFQYAFLEELKFRGRNAIGDIGWYYRRKNRCKYELSAVFSDIDLGEKDRFNYNIQFIKYVFAKIIKKIFKMKKLYFQEKSEFVYDNENFKIKSGILEGYWQTEKNFIDVKKIIRKKFEFKINDASLAKVSERLQKEKNTVAIHIRRGDYLNINDMYGNICTDEYYDNAIKMMEEKLDNPSFYIFTNDVEWAKKKYTDKKFKMIDISQIKSYQNWYDMYLMSICQNNIIANSTFSWWAAWLNKNENKIVIAPSKWINGMETLDIWCKDWIKLSGK